MIWKIAAPLCGVAALLVAYNASAPAGDTAYIAPYNAPTGGTAYGAPTGDMQMIPSSHSVTLGVGKSIVVDLPVDAKNVLIGTPKTVPVTMLTKRRAHLMGGEAGRTNVYFLDDSGRQIGGIDVSVLTEPIYPPRLSENASSELPYAVDVYRGGVDHAIVFCNSARCTPPPKEPPPAPTFLVLPLTGASAKTP